MEIIQMSVTAINFVLYFALLCMEEIFSAFGLSWIGVVSGLVVLSVLLRLFSANLVGSALGAFVQGGSARQADRTKRNYDPGVSRTALPSGRSSKLRKG